MLSSPAASTGRFPRPVLGGAARGISALVGPLPHEPSILRLSEYQVKTNIALAVLLASIGVLSEALPISGQAPAPEPAPEVAALDSLSDEEPWPRSLLEVEATRSRRCVPLLARLDALNDALNPVRTRTQRLGQLVDAVALEDTTRATPFDTDDPIEQAVLEWYEADQGLARQFLATGDTTLQAQRTEGREAILARVREAGDATAAEADTMVAATGDLLQSADACLGVMFVRDFVLEACEETQNALCAEARGGTPSGRFRLVEAPEDLWGVETLRPWSQPSRLGLTAQGTLRGASTNASATRGNVAVVVGIEPMLQDKTVVEPEDVARFEAALDSLGLTFEHTRFQLVPGLAIRLDVWTPLGGESYYFLHFGGLANLADDVIWSASAATGAPIAYMAPVQKPVLDRLAAGEVMSLTAVRFPESGVMEGEAVYTIELPVVSQAEAVGAVIDYISSGQLQTDFTSLVPPGPGPAGG